MITFVLPTDEVVPKLSSAMLHFIESYQIGIKCVLEETIRLVISTNVRHTPVSLLQNISLAPVENVYAHPENLEKVYPKFTEQEAKELYLKIVTIFYNGFYDSLRHIYGTRYLGSSGQKVNIKRFTSISDGLAMEVDVDYIPF